MFEQYSVPAHIQELMKDASQEDAYRLHLHGLMLAIGIIPRTSQFDASTGLRSVPIRWMNNIPVDHMKWLVREYYSAAWGANDVRFFTTVKDRKLSTEDVAYFHVSFLGVFRPTGANAADVG